MALPSRTASQAPGSGCCPSGLRPAGKPVGVLLFLPLRAKPVRGRGYLSGPTLGGLHGAVVPCKQAPTSS